MEKLPKSEWWDNGVKKSEGIYLDGAKTGIWKLWGNTGELLEEVEYRKGILVDPS